MSSYEDDMPHDEFSAMITTTSPEASSSRLSSPSTSKLMNRRKSKPWAVDVLLTGNNGGKKKKDKQKTVAATAVAAEPKTTAASTRKISRFWKQSMQERKAVFGGVAVPELPQEVEDDEDDLMTRSVAPPLRAPAPADEDDGAEPVNLQRRSASLDPKVDEEPQQPSPVAEEASPEKLTTPEREEREIESLDDLTMRYLSTGCSEDSDEVSTGLIEESKSMEEESDHQPTFFLGAIPNPTHDSPFRDGKKEVISCESDDELDIDMETQDIFRQLDFGDVTVLESKSQGKSEDSDDPETQKYIDRLKSQLSEGKIDLGDDERGVLQVSDVIRLARQAMQEKTDLEQRDKLATADESTPPEIPKATEKLPSEETAEATLTDKEPDETTPAQDQSDETTTTDENLAPQNHEETSTMEPETVGKAPVQEDLSTQTTAQGETAESRASGGDTADQNPEALAQQETATSGERFPQHAETAEEGPVQEATAQETADEKEVTETPVEARPEMSIVAIAADSTPTKSEQLEKSETAETEKSTPSPNQQTRKLHHLEVTRKSIIEELEQKLHKYRTEERHSFESYRDQNDVVQIKQKKPSPYKQEKFSVMDELSSTVKHLPTDHHHVTSNSACDDMEEEDTAIDSTPQGKQLFTGTAPVEQHSAESKVAGHSSESPQGVGEESAPSKDCPEEPKLAEDAADTPEKTFEENDPIEHCTDEQKTAKDCDDTMENKRVENALVGESSDEPKLVEETPKAPGGDSEENTPFEESPDEPKMAMDSDETPESAREESTAIKESPKEFKTTKDSPDVYSEENTPFEESPEEPKMADTSDETLESAREENIDVEENPEEPKMTEDSPETPKGDSEENTAIEESAEEQKMADKNNDILGSAREESTAVEESPEESKTADDIPGTPKGDSEENTAIEGSPEEYKTADDIPGTPKGDSEGNTAIEGSLAEPKAAEGGSSETAEVSSVVAGTGDIATTVDVESTLEKEMEEPSKEGSPQPETIEGTESTSCDGTENEDTVKKNTENEQVPQSSEDGDKDHMQDTQPFGDVMKSLGALSAMAKPTPSPHEAPAPLMSVSVELPPIAEESFSFEENTPSGGDQNQATFDSNPCSDSTSQANENDGSEEESETPVASLFVQSAAPEEKENNQASDVALETKEENRESKEHSQPTEAQKTSTDDDYDASSEGNQEAKSLETISVLEESTAKQPSSVEFLNEEKKDDEPPAGATPQEDPSIPADESAAASNVEYNPAMIGPDAMEDPEEQGDGPVNGEQVSTEGKIEATALTSLANNDKVDSKSPGDIATQTPVDATNALAMPAESPESSTETTASEAKCTPAKTALTTDPTSNSVSPETAELPTSAEANVATAPNNEAKSDSLKPNNKKLVPGAENDTAVETLAKIDHEPNATSASKPDSPKDSIPTPESSASGNRRPPLSVQVPKDSETNPNNECTPTSEGVPEAPSDSPILDVTPKSRRKSGGKAQKWKNRLLAKKESKPDENSPSTEKVKEQNEPVVEEQRPQGKMPRRMSKVDKWKNRLAKKGERRASISRSSSHDSDDANAETRDLAKDQSITSPSQQANSAAVSPQTADKTTVAVDKVKADDPRENTITNASSPSNSVHRQIPQCVQSNDFQTASSNTPSNSIHRQTPQSVQSNNFQTPPSNKLQDSFMAFEAKLSERQAALTVAITRTPSDDHTEYTEITIHDSDDEQFAEILPTKVNNSNTASGDWHAQLRASVAKSEDPKPSLDPIKIDKNENLGKTEAQAPAPSMPTLPRLPTITVNLGLDDDDMTQLTLDHPDDFDEAEAQDTPAEQLNVPGQITRKASTTTSVNSQSQKTERTKKTVTDYSETSRTTNDGASSRFSAASRKRVVDILRKDLFRSDLSVVRTALESLAKEASAGSQRRKNIARYGGLLAVVQIIVKLKSDSHIQIAACRALEKLSIDDDNRFALGEMGAIPDIIESMKQHKKNVKVQQAACGALAHVTRSCQVHGGQKDYYLSIPVGKAVEALCLCMAKYSKDGEIQMNAFISLANLCIDNPERLKELSRAGGMTTMTMALQKSWKSKSKKHEAISNLSMLLRGLAELEQSDSSSEEDESSGSEDDAMNSNHNSSFRSCDEDPVMLGGDEGEDPAVLGDDEGPCFEDAREELLAQSTEDTEALPETPSKEATEELPAAPSAEEAAEIGNTNERNTEAEAAVIGNTNKQNAEEKPKTNDPEIKKEVGEIKKSDSEPEIKKEVEEIKKSDSDSSIKKSGSDASEALDLSSGNEKEDCVIQ